MEPRLDAAGKASGRPYPLTIVAVVLISLYSVVQTRRGRAVWKDRPLAAGRSRG